MSNNKVKHPDNMDLSELRGWIAQFLETGDASPLNLTDAELKPDEIFIEFVKTQASSVLREKINEALVELAGSVSPYEEWRNDFFWNVITVVSQLKDYAAKKALIPVLNRGNFRGKIGRGQDLHARVIDVLASLGLHESETHILAERDIFDSRYSSISFRALYRANTSFGMKYLPIVVKMMLRYEDSDLRLYFVIRELIETIAEEAFINGFSILLQGLDTRLEVDIVFSVLEQIYGNNTEIFVRRIVDRLLSKGIRPYSAHISQVIEHEKTEAVLIEGPNIRLASTRKLLIGITRSIWKEDSAWLGLSWPQELNMTVPLLIEVKNNISEEIIMKKKLL